MKRKNRKVRSITVDGVEYKWLSVNEIKIWKDGKIFYEDGWGSSSKYPTVSFNLEDGAVTPKVIAKIIKLINGTEPLISNVEIFENLNNERFLEVIKSYRRHASFEDKRTEYKWAKFIDSYNELMNHLGVKKEPEPQVINL
jgi:hypothetical protein